MANDRSISLPEAGTLRAGAPPYLHGQPGLASVTRIFIVAAAIVVASGLVLFGWNTVRVLAISIAAAVLIDSVARTAIGRGESGAEGQAVLIGMLIACTLPATVYWPVPLIAAGLAVLVGQVISGGPGNYLWHSVAVGRIAVQVLFPEQLGLTRWPVLAPGHLLWGDLTAARDLQPPATWGSQPLDYGVQAWQVLRPGDVLAGAIPAHGDGSPAGAVAALVRDTLPPWMDTLSGVAGGAIGEACGAAVILAGLLLMWRGLARWPLPVAGVVTAALLAAILPVAIQPAGQDIVWHWLPGADVEDRLPVGLLYVAYNVTAGELLLVLMLMAPDPTSSPLTARGHAIFGAIIGGLTIALRTLTGIPAAGYWALLVANTLVPVINRATRRRVFGT